MMLTKQFSNFFGSYTIINQSRKSGLLKSIVPGSESDICCRFPVPGNPIICPNQPGPRTKFMPRKNRMVPARTYVNPLTPKSCILLHRLKMRVGRGWSLSPPLVGTAYSAINVPPSLPSTAEVVRFQYFPK